MNELALFAGAGGGILGGAFSGWRTVCAVEFDAYAASVLVSRQNDGCLEAFPVWDDVQTFDGRPWRGLVDVISGGFPCQDISTAGKGVGITGERSGLWKEFARIIGEVRPRFVFVENSPALTGRGLGTVLGDLAALGFNAEWGVLGAVDAGAPHKRERIWVVAYSGEIRFEPWLAEQSLQRSWENGEICGMADASRERRAETRELRCDEQAERTSGGSETVPDADSPGREEQRGSESKGQEHAAAECRGWWEVEPGVGRVVDGLAHRVDRLACLGNGQVPAVAAIAWCTLKAAAVRRMR